jgi:hypothetical protein
MKDDRVGLRGLEASVRRSSLRPTADVKPPRVADRRASRHAGGVRLRQSQVARAGEVLIITGRGGAAMEASR